MSCYFIIKLFRVYKLPRSIFVEPLLDRKHLSQVCCRLHTFYDPYPVPSGGTALDSSALSFTLLQSEGQLESLEANEVAIQDSSLEASSGKN